MTPYEIKFLIWSALSLLGILGTVVAYILNRSVNTLDKLGEDVNKIKEEMIKMNGKHEVQEKINEQLEKRIEKIEAVLAG